MNKIFVVVALLIVGCNTLPFQSEDTVVIEPTESVSLIASSIEEFIQTQPSIAYIATYVEDMSGSVDENGGVHSDVYPGDNTTDNADFIGFITFDISSLPDIIAQLESVVLSLDCETNGFPFNDIPFGLGPLYVELYDYDILGSEDYNKNGDVAATMTVQECPVDSLVVTDLVKSKIGEDLVQLKLYFLASNGDYYRDDIVIDNPVLVVSYIGLSGAEED